MKNRKFNILDIAVIIIILLLIFASYTKFRNYNAKSSEDYSLEKIEYVIKVYGVREYTSNAFEIGDKIYDTQTNAEIGTLINKEIKPTTGYEKIENGELIKVEVPERYDLTLTLETEGTITQNGYFANRSVELKVGSEKTIETLYAKSSGRISKIEQIVK